MAPGCTEDAAAGLESGEQWQQRSDSTIGATDLAHNGDDGRGGGAQTRSTMAGLIGLALLFFKLINRDEHF
ncbi:hypothetical protein SORBI_3001G278600 [Sorghum bicolor]|uniref:Uncharacterized protein n=1 Tax=Sorghum bicolor TaxID=4558 RepID=A0A1B6QLH5_SORBI|nr:hypothetical protein SORBI_3001G278600 [Sorghum bicolor]